MNPHLFSDVSQTLLVCSGILTKKLLNLIRLLVNNILFTPLRLIKAIKHVLLTHVPCATFRPCGWLFFITNLKTNYNNLLIIILFDSDIFQSVIFILKLFILKEFIEMLNIHRRTIFYKSWFYFSYFYLYLCQHTKVQLMVRE